MRFAILVILVASAPAAMAEAPDAGTDGLTLTLRPRGRVCDRRMRLALTITNVGLNTIWLNLDTPPGELQGLSTSYCHDSDCQDSMVMRGASDTMPFLRGGGGVRLDAGQSATWRVIFDPLNLHPGQGTVEVSATVPGTRDLSKPVPDYAKIRASARIKLVRRGPCFDVLGAG